MKRIIIVFLTSIYCSPSFAQTTPCTDSLILSKIGKWKYFVQDVIEGSYWTFPKSQYPQVYNRMDAMYKLVLEAYPQAAGTDPVWSKSLWGTGYPYNGPVFYRFNSYYPFYYCSQSFTSASDKNDNKVKFMGAEPSTDLYISANDIGYFFYGDISDIKINGLKVYPRAKLLGKWKGYDIYNSNGDSASYERIVLISRNGMLPYKPVTRNGVYPILWTLSYASIMCCSSKATGDL